MDDFSKMNDEIWRLTGLYVGTGLWNRPCDYNCLDRVDEIRILISEFFKEEECDV